MNIEIDRTKIDHALELLNNNDPSWNKELNEKEITTIVHDNKSLLRLSIDKGLEPDLKYFEVMRLIEYVNEADLVIYYFEKFKNITIFDEINETVASYRFSSGTTLYEILLKNNINIWFKMPNNKELIDLALKYNASKQFSRISEEVLFQNIEDNKTVLEYLSEKMDVSSLTITITKEKNLIKIKELGLLNKMNMYIDDFLLLIKSPELTGNDDSIINYLINNNINFKSSDSTNEVVSILIDNNWEFLGHILYLRDIIDLNKLDQLLLGIKSDKIKFNLDFMSFKGSSIEELADYYLKLAKYDMLPYIEFLRPKDLLLVANNKLLLTELLDKDKDLTVKKILPRIKKDPRIATILLQYGIEQSSYDVGKVETDINTDNDLPRLLGPISSEAEMLLKHLEELFKNDGKSSHKLINTLLEGYRNGLINFYDVTLAEIKNLIAIKERNPNTVIFIEEKDDSYYALKEVHSEPVLGILMHENGHLLHNIMAQTQTPEEYYELKERLQKDPETLERLVEFHKEITSICDRIRDDAKEVSEKLVDNTVPEELLSKELEETRNALLGIIDILGIDENTLNALLNKIYKESYYIDHKKRKIARQLYLDEYTNYHLVYVVISDIFDSIFDGKYAGKQLKDKEGASLEAYTGHGIPYSYHSDGFDEIIANISSIMKLPDGDKSMALLKKHLGEELFNLIMNFYVEKIVYGKIPEDKLEKVTEDIEENKRGL